MLIPKAWKQAALLHRNLIRESSNMILLCATTWVNEECQVPGLTRQQAISRRNATLPLMPEGPCFNRIWLGVILKNVTARRVNNRVKKVCREYYWLEPGHVFRGVPILLGVPMLIGIDEDAGRILMPFRKPCYGTSLYCIESSPEEIALLRAELATATAGSGEPGARGRKEKKSG